MQLSKKLKTALDETRMLMLGAEILLGFELRAAFSENFEHLPGHARHLNALSLALMTIVVGLLITPGSYHRIVEHGRDSGRLHAVATSIADLALMPFALALGIDLYIAAERVFGNPGAIAAGIAGSAVALGLWYGMPRFARGRKGQCERMITQKQRNERPPTPLHVKIEQMLTEARIILPGGQALLGFQLSIVLTAAFEGLPEIAKIVHALSIALVALSVMLLMAPAAYHRIVYSGEDSDDMHRTGSLLVGASLVPLALGLSGDIYVVIGRIIGPQSGILAGLIGFVLLAGMWFAFPFGAAMLRHQREAPPDQARASHSR